MPTSKKGTIEKTLCRDLVTRVQNVTNITYMKSKLIVDVVLSELADRVISTRKIMDEILDQRKSNPSSNDISLSDDAVALRQRFEELAPFQNHLEQRTSVFDEDDLLVRGRLDDLLDLLKTADSEMCWRVLEENGYTPVHTLVLYYQMETRVQLRLVTLQIFDALCHLNAKVVSELNNSVLPVELARGMTRQTAGSPTFMRSCLILTTIFSTGEPLPAIHYEHFNEEFLKFLFRLVEEPPDHPTVDELRDRVIPVILAFNLHLSEPDKNPVMNVLGKEMRVNRFLEELMMLVNREADPVRILTHKRHPRNSLMKFLSDMYSRKDTAKLFYTNDEKVLVGILLRHIQDCTPEHCSRREYLSVFYLMLKHSRYLDHCHHQKDFQEIFTSICLEEDHGEDTLRDKLIVKQIWKEFPHLFSV
ncbi:hypothetical protein LSH36_358g01009 [Paralvinella palmiformis]|uniref:SPIN90/Ldb17 leucine-rich domain-containing protein n=1 Tax=Paralvinella palmiformis TaxID=53620 RepID=A0AAD9N297_9ANNE|nr:hypothetical protein LSH36_358g01009 [Paralvinella palmiformis]